MPQRIQRKRTKGWKMPDNTVYVGRPSKWGNPYKYKNKEFAVQCFTTLCTVRVIIDQIKELKGKNLACWCALDEPCHADVLLKIANQ